MLRCAKGDQEAFDALFERYKDRIYDYLAHQIGDKTAAEDLLQETFLRVYVNRGRYRPGAPFKPWLFAIATNLCRDERRRQRKLGRAVPSDNAGDFPADPSGGELHSGSSPLQRLEAKEALEVSLQRLPQELREAFLLSRREGMSSKDVARAVGCSAACARQRVTRALRQLRRDLSEYMEDRG